MAFSSLIGQVVHVIVGGREYNGTVTKVGEDFLVMDDSAADTVILPFDHITSIGSGEIAGTDLSTKQCGMPGADGFVLSNCFREVLEGFRQTIVRIESVGAMTKVSMLLAVLSDYVVLCTVPEGLTFMPIMHIHVISSVNADVQPEFSVWAKEYGDKAVHANCMLDLLKTYIGKSIQLSRDSPEEVSGVLCSVDEYCAELVTSPVTRLYVPNRHIKRIDTFERVEWVPFKIG